MIVPVAIGPWQKAQYAMPCPSFGPVVTLAVEVTTAK
jgi:hypothetical protein